MNIGSTVKLKGCAGPAMTVRWVREVASKPVGVTCEWFDVNLHLQQHEFKPDTLEPVSAGSFNTKVEDSYYPD